MGKKCSSTIQLAKRGRGLKLNHNHREPRCIRAENLRRAVEHQLIAGSAESWVHIGENREEIERAIYEPLVEEYNQRHREKGHPERQKSYEELLKNMYAPTDKKGNQGVQISMPEKEWAIEMVFQFGNRDQDIPRDLQEKMLREFFEWKQERFPHMRTVDCVLHRDEASLHIHCCDVPLAEYTRGMRLQNNKTRALAQDGIVGQELDEPIVRTYSDGSTKVINFITPMEQYMELCRQKMDEIIIAHDMEPVHEIRDGLKERRGHSEPIAAYYELKHEIPELEAKVAEISAAVDDESRLLDERRNVILDSTKDKGLFGKDKSVQLTAAQYQELKSAELCHERILERERAVSQRERALSGLETKTAHAAEEALHTLSRLQEAEKRTQAEEAQMQLEVAEKILTAFCDFLEGNGINGIKALLGRFMDSLMKTKGGRSR